MCVTRAREWAHQGRLHSEPPLASFCFFAEAEASAPPPDPATAIGTASMALGRGRGGAKMRFLNGDFRRAPLTRTAAGFHESLSELSRIGSMKCFLFCFPSICVGTSTCQFTWSIGHPVESICLALSSVARFVPHFDRGHRGGCRAPHCASCASIPRSIQVGPLPLMPR